MMALPSVTHSGSSWQPPFPKLTNSERTVPWLGGIASLEAARGTLGSGHRDDGQQFDSFAGGFLFNPTRTGLGDQRLDPLSMAPRQFQTSRGNRKRHCSRCRYSGEAEPIASFIVGQPPRSFRTRISGRHGGPPSRPTARLWKLLLMITPHPLLAAELTVRWPHNVSRPRK